MGIHSQSNGCVGIFKGHVILFFFLNFLHTCEIEKLHSLSALTLLLFNLVWQFKLITQVTVFHGLFYLKILSWKSCRTFRFWRNAAWGLIIQIFMAICRFNAGAIPRQGTFIYVAPFRHKAIESALQRHGNTLKWDVKDIKNKTFR